VSAIVEILGEPLIRGAIGVAAAVLVALLAAKRWRGDKDDDAAAGTGLD
jgi:hypothetical protein